MSNYDEGPYKNWTAVSFPAVVWKVAILLDITVARQMTIEPYDADDNLIAGTGAALQAIITGDTSGAQIDLRLITISTGVSSVAVDPPACVSTPSNFQLYPSGATPGAPPFELAAIKPNTTPGDPGEPDHALAAITHYSSAAAVDIPPITCVSDFNAPALPAFIDGETVTLS